jgi:hypothetical protein
MRLSTLHVNSLKRRREYQTHARAHQPSHIAP